MQCCASPTLPANKTRPSITPQASTLHAVDTQKTCVLYGIEPAKGHDKSGHPESACRLSGLASYLDTKLAKHLDSVTATSSALQPIRCSISCVQQHASQRIARMSDLGLVHPERYVHAIQRSCARLQGVKMIDDASYIASGSFNALCKSVGLVLDLVDATMRIRPLMSQQHLSSATGGTGGPGTSLAKSRSTVASPSPVSAAALAPALHPQGPGSTISPSTPANAGSCNVNRGLGSSSIISSFGSSLCGISSSSNMCTVGWRAHLEQESTSSSTSNTDMHEPQSIDTPAHRLSQRHAATIGSLNHQAMKHAELTRGGCTDPSIAGSNQQLPAAACAFALVRPPGHHVTSTRPMGFGIFNIVAIAVQHARRVHGLDRIMVLDWDVHHGNGTEDIFYDDPGVLYVSTHQAGLWPNTGKARSIGVGAGEGTTINVPLPGGSGHDAMIMAWEGVIAPAAERYQPQAVFVSAGYDAHWADPLAGMQLRTSTYHMLCMQLRELAASLPSCHGRVVMVLEGGYHADSLHASVWDSLAGLAGLPSTDTFDHQLLQPEPIDKVQSVLHEVQRIHGL